MNVHELPMVSVVIPAFNAGERITRLLDSLESQQYPRERYEIIVVDNGSQDDTRERVAKYPVLLLSETRRQNPGSARNTGVRQAKGEVIAFIDADCIATPGWIAEAVKVIQTQKADLVAGNIHWLYSAHRGAAEIFDSLVHLRNDIHARENNTAVTANLVVWSTVFKKTGLFSEWKAGEDYSFCVRAAAAGFRMVFGPAVLVLHETRSLGPLLRKAWRVGRYHHHMTKVGGESTARFFGGILKAFVPGSRKHVQRLVRERGTPDMEPSVTCVWFISYLYNLVWGSAAITSRFRRVE
jgi:glycosyltransferase involved in cell wall biosynthesis